MPVLEPVRPGDLITADFMNRVIGQIEALEQRVAQLEEDDSGEANAPVITDITPNEVAVRGVMEVAGRNFATPRNRNEVTLDGEPLTGILPGSTTTLLRISVPTGLSGLPRRMTLTVTTVAGSASHAVTVTPEEQIPLGRPMLTDITTGLGRILVGATYTFLFRIDANAVTIPETYRLAAIYTNAEGATADAWEDATSFVGAAGGEVRVTPATPVTVGVNVTVPAGATSVSLTLRAISTHNDPASSSSSSPVPIVVGEEQRENDSRITIYLGEVGARMQAVDDEGELVLQIEYPAASTNPRTVLVPIETRFTNAGTYDYRAEIEDAGTLWTLNSVMPTNTTELAGGAQQVNVSVSLRATGPSDERRNLVFTATRRETTGVGRISARMVLPIEGFAP